jgi:hypothetical protein
MTCNRGHWTVFVLMAVVLAGCPGCPSQPPAGTELVSGATDWRAQDSEDSRGVTGVQYQGGRLVLDAHLVGQDAQYRAGEVLLDFSLYAPTEGTAPIDMTGRTIRVEVVLPAGYGGSQSAPNGVQVFVKDNQWRAQYGRWTNVAWAGGRYEVTLSPSSAPIAGGDTAFGFSPSRVRLIGVKFGINSNSSAQVNGQVRVNSVRITPELSLSPEPGIPSNTTQPVLDADDRIVAGTDGFYLNGSKLFVVGANWRVIDYGQNFGATAWFPGGNGVSAHPNFVKAYLDYARRAGIKVLRVGLLDDGRTMFDQEGHVTGYSQVFRDDVRVLLDLAAQAGCRIEFTLVDFLIAGKGEELNGVWMRGRAGILTDATLRSAFVSQFLVPFLSEFGQHPGLFGIDIINEPEWIINKENFGAWEDYDDAATKAVQPVSGVAFNAFVAACAEAIHTNAPNVLVTVGTSMKFIPLVQNLDTDYLALHHYAWMGPMADHVSHIPQGKPWSLEEYPTVGATPAEYLTETFNAGGSGGLLWNLSPGIDNATVPYVQRNSLLQEVREWVE